MTNTGISRRTALATLGASAALASLPASAQARIEFKLGNAGGPTTISNKFNIALFEAFEKRTNGAVKTQIFAGTLGGEQRLLEGMSLGTLDYRQ